MPKRYSIRAVLLITFASACLFAYEAARDAQRRRVIAKIEEHGGTVTFRDGFGLRGRRVDAVELPWGSLRDQVIRSDELKSFPALRELSLMNFRFEGNGISSSDTTITMTFPDRSMMEETLDAFVPRSVPTRNDRQ